MVYLRDRQDKAMRDHSKDEYPEECQVMVVVAQLTKPRGTPIGLMIMPDDTHDKKHRLETFGQIQNGLTSSTP